MILIADVKQENDRHLLGKEAFELSTLASLGINIPDGFVITTEAYFEFLKENNLRTKVNHLLENFDKNTARHIQKVFLESDFSDVLIKKIFSSYRQLDWNDSFVSLIPSTTDSHLKLESKKVKGEASLLQDIKEIWASYFSSELILHRIHRDLNHFKTGIAVIVQKDLRVKKSPNLTQKEKKELAKVEAKISKFHYFPKKIFWIISEGKVYATGLSDIVAEVIKPKSQIITTSVATSPTQIGGIATGVVGKEIIVLQDLKYDKLSEIKDAKAIVIESDNISPHLKTVLQRMGLPVIIGKKTDLKPGTVATVDATKNAVYKGEFKV